MGGIIKTILHFRLSPSRAQHGLFLSNA